MINKIDGNYIEIKFSDNKVSILRDKFGSIPLYYRLDCSYISTSLSDLVLPDDEYCINSMSHYITNGILFGSDTPYKNIKKLCPYERLIFINKNFKVINIENYFPNISNDFKIEILEEIILNSIENIRSIEDNSNKILLNLSGGNDSSLLLSLMNHVGFDSDSIISNTFYHSDWRTDFDDWIWSKRVADIYSINNQLCKIDVSDFNKFNLELIHQTKGLYHTYGTAFHCQTSFVKNNLDNESIIINGSGPDEVIIGTEKIEVSTLINQGNKSYQDYFNYLFTAQDYNKIPLEEVSEYFLEKVCIQDLNFTKLVEQSFNTKKSFADNQRCFHSLFVLQDHISTLFAASGCSKMAMIFPFLTNDFFDFCFSTQFNILNNESIYKKCIKDILIKYLPHDIVYRKKIGFQSPSRIYFANKNLMGLELLTYFEKNSSILNLDKLIQPINKRLMIEASLIKRYDFLEWNILNILRLENISSS
ncbi:asparagine synthase C-terminal domain-containing protein [Prochlorococcus sp. MIT 0801]|uniref:asparagine synthase-related protein n=1 Tax=Prochlorococcus sp. MIT 0801 TaxID=1501269 RepID=UPI0018CEDDE5|nr:asparagine synthase C-terminal domain-containing protein [Prochlorococcus sp. MIT 0801]